MEVLENAMPVIPPDDIMEEYLKFPHSVKCAIANMKNSSSFVLGTIVDPAVAESSEVSYLTTADWACGPDESLVLALNIILVGQRMYGITWVEKLFQKYAKTTNP